MIALSTSSSRCRRRRPDFAPCPSALPRAASACKGFRRESERSRSRNPGIGGVETTNHDGRHRVVRYDSAGITTSAHDPARGAARTRLPGSAAVAGRRADRASVPWPPSTTLPAPRRRRRRRGGLLRARRGLAARPARGRSRRRARGRRRSGAGASTRNGGMVIPELKHGPRALARRYGPLGGELVDARARRVRRSWSARRGAAASTVTTSAPARSLRRAPRRAAARACGSSRTRVVDDLGLPARFRAPRRAPRRARVRRVLRRARARARRRPAAGEVPRRAAPGRVRLPAPTLHDHTAPWPCARASSSIRRWPVSSVFTTRGPIEAAEVFVATNAYADELIPALRRRVLPVGSFIIATEVLDPRLPRRADPATADGVRHPSPARVLAPVARRPDGVRRPDRARADDRRAGVATSLYGGARPRPSAARGRAGRVRVGRQRRDHARSAAALRPDRWRRVRDRVQRNRHRARDLVRVRRRGVADRRGAAARVRTAAVPADPAPCVRAVPTCRSRARDCGCWTGSAGRRAPSSTRRA